MINTEAIVLRSTQYTSNSYIVKAFSKDYGVVNFMLRSGKKSKKTAFKEQLSIIDLSFSKPLGDSLNSPSEIKQLIPYTGLALDFFKRSQALFLSEILDQCIQEEAVNQDLYAFVKAALLNLDTGESSAFFHVNFIGQLMAYLGIQPQLNNGSILDLQEGKTLQTPPPHQLFLNEKETNNFILATRGELQQDIKATLGNLLLFYRLHVAGFKDPKSLDVLKEVYAGI